MKSAAAILMLLVCCRPGPAQTKTDNQLSPNVRIYEPKNLTAERAQQVANFVTSVLTGVQVGWSSVPHAIIIRAIHTEDLEAAEALLKRFDVPEPRTPDRLSAPRMDCTVYLIRASTSPPRTALPTSPVPAELQPAIDEMKHSFGYDRYSLWDALIIQSAGGAGEMQGILPVEAGSAPYIYSVSYMQVTPAERDLKLYGFQFSVKMPSNFFKEGIESRIKTDVIIHEGQKLVLGKIRLLPTENADLFLVLATKVH